MSQELGEPSPDLICTRLRPSTNSRSSTRSLPTTPGRNDRSAEPLKQGALRAVLA